MTGSKFSFIIFSLIINIEAVVSFASPAKIVANQMTLMQRENKAIAEGDVISTQDDQKLLSDKLIAFFEKQEAPQHDSTATPLPSKTSNLKRLVATTLEKNKPILLTTPQINLKCYTSLTYDVQAKKSTALGNVHLKNIKDNYVMLAPKIVTYFFEETQKIKKMQSFGGVTIIRGSQKALGRTAIYKSQDQSIELFDDVILLDNGKKLTGSYAHMDLETGISKVFANKKNQIKTQQKKKVHMLLSTPAS
mgnify:CR=1 FL=1